MPARGWRWKIYFYSSEMFLRNKKKFILNTALKQSGRAKLKIVGRRGHVSEKNAASAASRIFYWLALLSFAGAVFYVIFLSPLVSIAKIEIFGTENCDSRDIQSEVEAKINGKNLNLFPRNNFILAGEREIEENILDRFNLVESAEVEKNFPDKLVVKIKERQTGLVLCGAGECFVLDDQGRAFAPANFETNELKENELIRLSDDSGKSFKIEEAVLDPEYLKYILEAGKKIQDQAGVLLEKEAHTPQIASGDIRMKSEEGWLIYLDREVPAEKEAEALRLVLENKIGKEERKNLEYVDLRAENKVYYKFR